MLKELAKKSLQEVGIKVSDEELEIPKEEFGDVAYPCFQLAKRLKKNPIELAEELAKKIKPKGFIKKVESKGGYINFFLNWKKICKSKLSEIFEKVDLGKGKKVMVEYSQPNPVHPMHIGHARTTFLGDSIANILEFVGHEVIRANYMNDTGLQVAKLVTAYLKWAKSKKPEGKPDFWLWKLYVKFHEEAKKNLELEEEAREVLRKFELDKDKEIIKIWNKIVRWCVKGFEETYKRVGINFDVYFYETDVREFGKKLVEKALKNKIAFKSPEGTIVADLEKYRLGNVVLLRSDGTGLYITSDLGLTVEKFERYKLDKSIWVVSSQQILHFKQLFKILELLGYKWAKNCHHLHFEHVVLPEGKMSSREGRAIMLDEVFEKLKASAYKEVDKRNPKLDERIKKEIAEKIAIAALKYNVLRIEPDDRITFDWKRMLQFEGNTGPYLQYSYVRCSSILKKAGKFRKKYEIKELNAYEKRLLRKIFQFNEIIKKSAIDLRTHYICNYAYELSSMFNEFYEKVPVLRSDEKGFRLTLVWVTGEIIKQCLNLLGIDIVERM